MQIPENYQTVMPYLILDKAENFSSFTKAVFNAVEKMNSKREDGTIQHAEIMIGGCTIMYSDSIPGYPADPASLFVYVDEVDAAFEKAQQNGATVVEAISERDYGRTCGVKDSTGNTWWITSPKK